MTCEGGITWTGRRSQIKSEILHAKVADISKLCVMAEHRDSFVKRLSLTLLQAWWGTGGKDSKVQVGYHVNYSEVTAQMQGLRAKEAEMGIELFSCYWVLRVQVLLNMISDSI